MVPPSTFGRGALHAPFLVSPRWASLSTFHYLTVSYETRCYCNGSNHIHAILWKWCDRDCRSVHIPDFGSELDYDDVENHGGRLDAGALGLLVEREGDPAEEQVHGTSISDFRGGDRPCY